MKRRIASITAALILVFCFLFTACSLNKDEYFVRYTVIFNGALPFYTMLLGANAETAYNEMLAELEKINADINLTVNSPLRILNESTEVGKKIEVNQHTYNLLRLSETFHADTDGYFNIAVQGLSELWRVDSRSSFLFHGVYGTHNFALPDLIEIERQRDILLSFSNTDTPFGIKATNQDGKFYLEKVYGAQEIKIDFGAIAKGYAADICIEIAKKHEISSALVDVASEFRVYGHFVENGIQTGFIIGIDHPRPDGNRAWLFSPDKIVFALEIYGDNSVVVSGDYQRYYHYLLPNETLLPVCHLINPFTGMPLGITHNGETFVYNKNSVISTVITGLPSAAKADAFTTAAGVKSFEDSKAFFIQNRIQGAVMTGQNIAFIGLTESDLYRAEVYNAFRDFDTVLFLEFA